MLERVSDARGRQAAGERAGALGDRKWFVAEGARAEEGVGDMDDVGDRREVEVDADCSEGSSGCCAFCGGDLGERMSAAARNGGAQVSRRTSPPSWSVMISSGGLPPALAAAWSSAICARVDASPPAVFSENKITPPTSPARTRSSSAGGGVLPA